MTYENLTIILPTLNEAGNIKLLIEALQSRLPSSNVIVVDDQSTDGTPARVAELALANPKIRLIERIDRAGLTKSIMTGVRSSVTEYVAWMDADFSHPPEVLKELYSAAQLTGCAIATRYAKVNGQNANSSVRQNDSLMTSVLSAVLNFFVHRVLKLTITDYTSGFIVCRRDLLAHHQFIGDYGEYFIEIMYYLEHAGIRVTEVPFNSPPRHSGYSKTGTTLFKLVRRGIKYIILVLRLAGRGDTLSNQRVPISMSQTEDRNKRE